MNESQLQKLYNNPIYPRDSKIHSDNWFVNIENGSQGGTHWCAFHIKYNKSYYFDSFGLKLPIGNYTCNLAKYDKLQIIDTTHIRSGNARSTVLQSWKIICNDKSINGKLTDFIKSMRSSSPTTQSQSEATSLPPIGIAFMYIDSSGDNHGKNVFVSFERKDIVVDMRAELTGGVADPMY